MAQRVFHATNYTPTSTADTSALANATYQALKGGSSTQLIGISEIMVMGAGTAAATGYMFMQLARVTTVETTATALASPNSDGPKRASTAALAAPPVSFVAASAGPQRSASTSDAKLDLTINALGGIVRWQVPKGEEFGLIGNTQPLGEVVLSQFTGGNSNAISSHLVYEPE